MKPGHQNEVLLTNTKIFKRGSKNNILIKELVIFCELKCYLFIHV